MLTVLDEAETIDALLESVAGQTRRPEEIVTVDGGSRDGTWERLGAWTGRLPLRAIRAAGANISRGRNLAIEAARADVLAVTDAGVRLDPRWLERLLRALTPEVDVVSGFFRSDARSAFEVAMGASTLPRVEALWPNTFLPSSRSLLMRRSAWQAVGGYPEWLDYCEDLRFVLDLRRAGCRFAFAPEAVAWFRPRGTLRAFFRQYYLYARGDGKGGLWSFRHAARYGAFLGAGALLLRAPDRWWAWAAVLAGGALHLWRPYRRLLPQLASLPPGQAARAVLVLPLIRVLGDVANMAGYVPGLLWRARRRLRDSGAPS